MKIIARIRTAFPEKFGIPRQSGLLPELEARIVFEPEFRVPEALRGIEGYSYLWLIWEFSEAVRDTWSPTVRPPRLGGNTRVGVFATRSPFRPNPIGLSSVRLLRIEKTTQEGTVLIVSGADLLDGTPIYDIKPYLPYTDSHPDAESGFAGDLLGNRLHAQIPETELCKIPAELRNSLTELLENDPRPSYQSDPEREYGLKFSGFEVRFKVADEILSVLEITEKP